MQDDSRIIISGVGVLSPLGDTFASVSAALQDGQCGVRPSARDATLGESRIFEFEPARYVDVRGMRMYDRATQLAICTAHRALRSANWLAEGRHSDLGVVMASTLGHLNTLLEYDGGLARVGVRRTNPALMPLALASASASATALALEAGACAISLAGGAPAALDALALAARLLGEGRARACVVVAAFSPALALTQSAKAAGKLTSAERFVVFDHGHAGTVYGEMAVALVLERESVARARGAPLLAQLRGHTSTTALDPEQLVPQYQAACTRALASARLAPRELSLVSASADGTPVRDGAEALALLSVLGESAQATPVCAVSANCGDGMEASGLMQVMLALSVLESGAAPMIRGFTRPAREGLGYMTRTTQVAPGPVLVSAMSDAGTCSALVVGPARS